MSLTFAGRRISLNNCCAFRVSSAKHLTASPMAGLLSRMSSFFNWPTDHSVSPVVLANAGFRYTGCGDRVACPVCDIEIEGWESGRLSSPRNEHITRSPNCSLASECIQLNNVSAAFSTNRLSSHTNNSLLNSNALFTAPTSASVPPNSANGCESSPPSDNQRVNIKPTVHAISYVASNGPRANVTAQSDVAVDRNNPDFDRLKAESVRFSTYHDWPPDAHVQSSQLAADGWFYTGQNDRVCCAFCRGTLHHWSKNDKPSTEHRKHFPKCPFVQGRDVGNVPLGQRAAAAQGYGCASAAASQITSLGSEAVRKETDVKTSDKHTAVGGSEPTKNEAAFGRSSSISSTSSQQQHKSVSTRLGNTLANDAAEEDEERRLLAENRQLMEARTCKVCMDKEVDTVFLPCGHLVACHECAPKLRDCAVCRNRIRGTVKTFLS